MDLRLSLLTLLCSVLVLSACIDESAKKQSTAPAEKAQPSKKKMAFAKAGDLLKNYHETPTSQAQKDENALLDYAVDKELDVKKTASGLYYVIHQEGKGPFYFKGEPCKAHYSGYTLDGKIFDSSYNRNKPLAFKVGQMIPGWNEALTFMNPGTKAQLLIPSHLAYGKRGFPGLIGPDEPLVFDIDLLPFIELPKKK